MNVKKRQSWTGKEWFAVTAILLPVLMVTSLTVPAFADSRQKTEQLVDKARFSLESFMSDSNMSAFRDLLKQAKGVLIVPQLLKGAFIFGASGGSGVLLTRDEKTGQWIGPAFYTLGGASFGLQIGGEASEVVLLVMTDRGINSVMANSFKLGVDVGLAAGPIGAGVAASTANLSADILSFARSKGLYGGISLDGVVVAVRGGLNEAYYGKKVTPAEIIVSRDVTNPQAHGLLESVARSACDERTGHC